METRLMTMKLGQKLAWDLKLAWKSFRRRPGVPLVVVLTLGLGIGANTAIYSLVDALIFRPLPFGEADRLVRMRDSTHRPGQDPWPYNTSPRSYQVLKESGVFQAVTAQRYILFNLTGDPEPMTATGIGVSPDWLRTLRIEPHLGRGFTEEEHALGREAGVVLLGHGLWQGRFGASPEILGRRITLNEQPHTVIGVMPPRFNYPYGSQLWVPDRFDPANADAGPNVAARIRDGESIASTQEALDALSRQAAERYPDSHSVIRFLAVPLRESLLGSQPGLGLALLGAVGFLLLIACGNVANLLLTRSLSRRRDMALRSALGAGRKDHVRLLLVESLMLAGAGGILGLALAVFLLDPMATLSIAPDDSLGAFFTDLRLDGRVLAFNGVLILATALLFGMAPALRTTRLEPAEALRRGRGSEDGAGRRIRDGLVVAEVALSVVLLSGAAVLVGGFLELRSQELGYETENRLAASLVLPDSRFPEAGDRLRFLEDLEARLGALPGVARMAFSTQLPVSGGSTTRPIVAEGGPASESGRAILTNHRGVDADYLPAMGMQLLQGRTFTETELREGRGVAVLNRSAARAYWPDGSAVGRRVRFGTIEEESPWYEVVGVVADAREEWELQETWYVPWAAGGNGRVHLVVESSGAVPGLPGQLRQAVWSIEPDQPIESVATLESLVSESFAAERMGASVVGFFGAVGLLLAVLGIYGVVSYGVNRRRREMGIRRALGAGRSGVQGMVLKEGGRLLAAGLALGAVGAVFLVRGMDRLMSVTVPGGDEIRSMAGQVSLDPILLASVLAVLAAIGLLATWLPARRAGAVDPATILREE